jgi:hypothetical protein
MRPIASALFGLGFALGCVAFARPASADQSVIKFPGMHPRYVFEAEPHVLVAPFHDFLPGVGFRGTIEIVDNGFIPSINNTVGIGFGADFAKNGVWIPIVMQWNFWLSRNWSVFGEPGVAIRAGERLGRHDDGVGWFGLWAGGRYHFSDHVTLTMRVGRPTVSLGVSFLL